MAFAPDTPFPKEKGDAIRSKDWNDLVEEVLRLDTEKVGSAGGRITGNLTVSGNIGVGTTSPKDRLDVRGAICFNGDANQRIFGAVRDGNDAVVLDGHWDELEVKGRVIDWTGSNLHIGYNRNHPTDMVFIGGKTRGVVLHSGGAADQTLVARDTLVGIGTPAPDAKLDVVGESIRLQKPANRAHTLNVSAHGNALDIYTTGADLFLNNNDKAVRVRNFVNISSRDYKDEIASLTPRTAAQALAALEPVEFCFNDDAARARRFGFISEDSPDMVTTEDKKGIDPMAIVAILTRVVQEQQAIIGGLREELDRVRGRLAAVEASVPA